METLKKIQAQLDRIEAGLFLQKNILSLDEVAKFTGFSKSYLYKLCHKKKTAVLETQWEMHFRGPSKIRKFFKEELYKNR